MLQFITQSLAAAGLPPERRVMEELDLKEIAGGALQEKVDIAMRRVLDNMQDPNTPWKVKRQITVKIAFTQNEERDDASVELSVDTKLAPVLPVKTRMAIGRDLRDGTVYAEEYGRQIRGQMSLDMGQEASERVTAAGAGDTENKVLDLRRAAL